MLNLNKTVRDIAVEMPEAMRVFENLKIDYCCGGHQPLSDACVNAGVEFADVERLLEEAVQTQEQPSGSIDFQSVTLSELINHILEKHHVYTKAEVVRLEALIAKVIAAHGANHPELLKLAVLFQQVSIDLAPHMFKEEQVLFPYIIAMEKSVLGDGPAPFAPFGTVGNPVRMMMMEHDTVGDLLRQLRAVTSNYSAPADGCFSYQTLFHALAAFEQDLHQHIHLENNILFPRAIELETRVQ